MQLSLGSLDSSLAPKAIENLAQEAFLNWHPNTLKGTRLSQSSSTPY
jgi:hypothetical protein